MRRSKKGEWIAIVFLSLWVIFTVLLGTKLSTLEQQQQQVVHPPSSGMIEQAVAEAQQTICIQRIGSECAWKACDNANDNGDQQLRHNSNSNKSTYSSSSSRLPVRSNQGFFFNYSNPQSRGSSIAIGGSFRAGSGCALSHKYRFLFLHTLKSGGSTIKAFLKRALCDGSTTMPCSNGNDVLEIVDCQPAYRQYSAQNYFVWTFVRNPFRRTYSGFSMADSMKIGHGDHSELSFEEFVLASNGKRHRMSLTSTSHYLPQVRFLTERNSLCPVVDFVGRLESFETDLQTVLTHLQSRELQEFYDKHGHGRDLHEPTTAYGQKKLQQKAGAGVNLESIYNHHTELMEAVAEEYEEDFRLLFYDPTHFV